MILPPDRDRAIGLLARISERAHATGALVAKGDDVRALRAAERLEHDATAVREELENHLRESR